MITGVSVESRLEARARELGFSLFGISAAGASPHMDYYRSWVRRGVHGEMRYLSREDSLARRADLRGTMEGVKSVVVVAHEYYTDDGQGAGTDPSQAVIARYARGEDYHDVVKRKLEELLRWLDASVEGRVRGRPYVDTGPILERDLAQRAGLGWFGRNTMIINPRVGSYFFIGVILVDAELTPTAPFTDDRCGTCSACLDACPTAALLGRDDDGAPVMDAARCISYLTIESRGPIPRELRPAIGNRVFGCDICQEVCPWNERFAKVTQEPAYLPRHGLDARSLRDLAEELVALDDDGFRVRFKGSPVARAKRSGLLRNVCVGLGNDAAQWADPLKGSDAPPYPGESVLAQALVDEDSIVRGHAAWALGRVGSQSARGALLAQAAVEADADALLEISQALGSDVGED